VRNRRSRAGRVERGGHQPRAGRRAARQHDADSHAELHHRHQRRLPDAQLSIWGKSSMADAFTGEIRAFGFNYPPVDWAMCNGQPMVATQYQALFSLIGTTYGSSGQPNFNLPDLRGRVPMSQGSSGGSTPPKIGTTSGEEQVPLTASQGPAHSHTLNVSGAVAGTSGVTLSNQPTVNVSYPSEISAKSGRGSITSVSFFSNAAPN